MTRLLASDLDGTLLQSGGTVSQENIQAIARARAEGLDVLFVTGRPPRWMYEISHMTGSSGLAICANGALTLDLLSHEIVDVDLIDGDIGLEVARLLLQVDPGMSFAVELARHDDAFVIDPTYRPRWETQVEVPRMNVEAMFDTERVVKLMARPSEQARHDADTFLASVHSAVGDLVDVTHSDIFDVLLEMSVLGVNKGTGLARFASDLGLDATQVAAVGDMPNDLAMIEWAGRGAAVANAHPMIKEIADEHLPTNDEHAVAVFIDRILSN